MKTFIIELLIMITFQYVGLASYTLKGSIYDENNNKLSGASIKIEATALGAYSNKEGYYIINKIPEIDKEINVIVSMVGYRTINTKIPISKINSTTDFVLRSQPLQTDEVIVTANKRVQAVQDVPISVSIIDSRGIMDRGITKLDEALLFVPGLEVNQDNINIRGTSGFSFGIGSRVAVLMDGFPMLAGDNNDVKFDALPMMNISRIEVVKGAGSALYGTSALGGVINLISEEPLEVASVKINAFSGIYTKPRFEQWVWNDKMTFYSGLNTSFSKKINDIDLLLSAQYIKDEGYREFDDGIRASIFSKFKYKLSDIGNVGLLINAAIDDKTDWVYWNGLDSATKPPSNTDQSIRVKSYKLSVFGDYNQILTDKSFLTFRTGAFITHYHNTFSESDLEYRQSDAINFNSELQFNTKLNDVFIFTYGLNTSMITVNSRTYGNQNQNIYSAYFQGEYSGIEDFIFTLGARLDYEDVKDVDGTLELSPKAGISYFVAPEMTIRASVGRGFRAPAVAERYSSVAFQGFDVFPNPGLKPEVSWSVELGINYKTEIAKNPLYFDFAIFRNDLTDLIEPTFVSSATSQIQFQNVKEARIQGIEFSAKTFLFGLIGLESSVTLMDPVDLTLNQTLNYRSELLWYNRLFLPIEPFELQFDYRFKTKAQNVDRQLGLLIKDIDARVDMHVLDVRFIYNLDKIVKSDLRLILSARNVLDYYYTEMVGNLAPTRMIMLQLEAKF